MHYSYISIYHGIPIHFTKEECINLRLIWFFRMKESVFEEKGRPENWPRVFEIQDKLNRLGTSISIRRFVKKKKKYIDTS